MITTPEQPTTISRLYVRYVVGFSVGVGLGVSPFLGRAGVPGFEALLTLFPTGLQNTIVPLASFVMGTIAVAVQFYRGDRISTRTLRRRFARTLAVIAITGVLLVATYTFVVTSVPVERGEAREAFITGLYRQGNCPCADLSDRECIEQISLNEAAVAACWGDKQIRAYTLLLTLLYLVLTGGFGGLIGLVILRERPPKPMRR